MLGCSTSFFIKWLLYRKKTIPSSKDISLFELSIDHVIPITDVLLTDPYIAFNWRNCRPVTKEYNVTKKDIRIAELEKDQLIEIDKFLYTILHK